jgi:hypothetical protein
MANGISKENINGINKEKRNKEIIWEKTIQKVDKIVDALGKGVDEGIKETICALWVHGFKTRSSCEGHLDWGLPYPWIEIYTFPPSGFDETTNEKRELMEKEWRFKNLKQQKRMLDFLEEFYRERKSPLEAHLIFKYIGAYGCFRIQSFGGEIMDIYLFEEKKKKLELYREEMKAFTEFLKNKFFSAE